MVNSDTDAVFVFDFLHDEDTLDAGDILMSADNVEQELLVVLHVGCLDAQQIVETARYVVTFCHLSDVFNHVGELVSTFGIHAA